MFRKLDAEQIVATASRLDRRIEERFPGAGLAQLAREPTQVTREAHALSAWLAAPNKPLRLYSARSRSAGRRWLWVSNGYGRRRRRVYRTDRFKNGPIGRESLRPKYRERSENL